ncbi:MAG: T9SS type A sorting domain-containing protein [Bacteroidales bacterium]|nr:T9SS type A sorting domain-containing protein [Bacteroidales bacterium]
MRKTVLLWMLVFSGVTVVSQEITYREKLYYTCKVWGMVKYYHSRVSVGLVNWDTVLVHTMPLIKNAATVDGFNDALDTLLAAAGPMAIATTPSPDTLPAELKRNLNFGWNHDPLLRSDIQLKLDTIIGNFRPHTISWVIKDNGTTGSGYLNFPYDDPMLFGNAYINYPGEFIRLLILFKYWNIINYFNPYNYILDQPWDSTLFNHALAMAEAPDYISFFKTIKKIVATLDDGHAEGTSSTAYSLYGTYTPNLILRYMPSGYVVVTSGYGDIFKGDVIVSIDNLPMDQMEDSLRPYISAGNLSVFRKSMSRYLLRGAYGSQIQIEYKDSLGDSHTKLTNRNYQVYDNWYPNDTLKNVKFKKWDCNVGYVNMGKLLDSDVDTMYSVLQNTTTIIFDIRNYPNGTVWEIANLMYPDSICFSKLTLPDVKYPGTYSWDNQTLGTHGNINSYQGQVIILCNQQTISHAEYSCMVLKAMPNSVVVGSQTAGADGNISWFHLSQEIQTGFTSLGVFYPNGDSTQRIGIVPDSVVYPTPAGIRQGRDEVLEKALQVAGCLVPIGSVTPATQQVTATAGTTGFTLTANTNWSVWSDAAWCTVTSSGSGNGTIVAEYMENVSYQPRIANIHVTVAGLPEEMIVTVNQDKSTIGINDLPGSPFQIYPNPTTGICRIIPLLSETGMLAISVQDIYGRIILEKQCKGEKDYEIDLSLAPKGSYFIIIRTGERLLVHKLIIH